MNIINQFNEWYKKTYGKENTVFDNPGEITEGWKTAWDEFIKTVMSEKWEDIKQEYLSMELLTNRKKKQLQKQINSDIIVEESSESKSDWDLVHDMMT